MWVQTRVGAQWLRRTKVCFSLFPYDQGGLQGLLLCRNREGDNLCAVFYTFSLEEVCVSSTLISQTQPHCT